MPLETAAAQLDQMAARAKEPVAVALAEAAQGSVRIATEAAQRAAEAAQDARKASATQPAEAARAARRAQLAAARAQEAAAEATDDLRQVSLVSPTEPRPGWLVRMKHKLEARSAFARGKELYEGRDLQGARPFLEEAVRLDPEYDEARALLGWLEYFSGEPRSAIVTFKTALRREPTWEGLYNGLGWSRLRVGRPQLARDAFRAALEPIHGTRTQWPVSAWRSTI